MAIVSRQTSVFLEQESKTKASNVAKLNQNLISSGGSGNEVISGSMVGSTLRLSKSDGSTVSITNIVTSTAYDNIILNSTSTTITSVEADTDWALA
jgi:ethanolamine utilization protein EutQ (cupin superfamily)